MVKPIRYWKYRTREELLWSLIKKIQGTTLQIPTTGYHTVDETANILSVKSIILF